MNKSEELAKLLGIEPKEKECPHRGCRNHITHPCEVCNNKRFVLVYPDFTKPDNFVKIMGLAYKNDCLSCIFINYKKNSCIQDVFIDLIIQDFSDESYKQNWAKQYIKIRKEFERQAQQTDWSY